MNVRQITSFGNDFRQVTSSVSKNWQQATTTQARRMADNSGASFVLFDPKAPNKRLGEEVFAKALNTTTGRALRQQGVIV